MFDALFGIRSCMGLIEKKRLSLIYVNPLQGDMTFLSYFFTIVKISDGFLIYLLFHLFNEQQS